MKCMNKSNVKALTLMAVLFYGLHLIFGHLAYDGYDFKRQAISDLTASDGTGNWAARLFSTLYGLFSVIAIGGVYYLKRDKLGKRIKRGLALFGVMLFISFIGYYLFPLSSSGYEGTFQDIMHIVVTGFVVLLTLCALVILSAGFYKEKQQSNFYITLSVILLLMTSGFGTALVPSDYFGLVERISVYTVIGYFVFLVFTLLNHD